jgi:hypothetical protein
MIMKIPVSELEKGHVVWDNLTEAWVTVDEVHHGVGTGDKAFLRLTGSSGRGGRITYWKLTTRVKVQQIEK